MARQLLGPHVERGVGAFRGEAPVLLHASSDQRL